MACAIIVSDGIDDERIRSEVASLADPRFSLVCHSENRGPAASRNTAIARSRTEWIAAVDADDVLSPGFSKCFSDAARATPGADAFFGDFEWIGDRTGRVRWAAQDLEQFLKVRTIPGPGVVYRRMVWERAGGYCEAAIIGKAGIEDFEFWLKALEGDVRVVHVDEVLYLYRRHSGSLMTTPNPDYHLAREYVYSLHRECFDLHRAGGRYKADGYWRSVADSYCLERRRQALACAGFPEPSPSAGGCPMSAGLACSSLRAPSDRPFPAGSVGRTTAAAGYARPRFLSRPIRRAEV